MKLLFYFAQLIIIFFAYFITAKIGLSLQATNNFATLIWAPTGIAIASVIIFGYKVSPAIASAAFFVNYITGAQPPAALGISVGNTLEAVIAAYLLDSYGFDRRIERLSDAVNFIILAGFIATMMSAFIGPTTLLLSEVIESGDFTKTFITWWIGDILGALVIAPLILVWSVGIKRFYKPPKAAELAFAVSFFFFCTAIVFSKFLVKTAGLPIQYIILPPLIWLSLRFGQKEGATVRFLVTVFAIWSTILGLGPFVQNDLHQSLILLQGFLDTFSITFLVMSAAVSEKKAYEEQRDDLVRIASHEFRTPLTTLKAYGQLLETMIARGRKKELSEYAQQINRQIVKLSNLVNDLVETTKLGSGKLKIKKETFSIDELVGQSVKDAARISPSHQIDYIAKSKMMVTGDKFRISQVLTNLLSNAVKFSSSNKKIIVKAVPAKNTVIISVRDHGVGIEKKDRFRVFDRYFQGKNKKSINPAGFGLGLYISSQIVKNHGGRIWVKTTRTRGSEFLFQLPATI